MLRQLSFAGLLLAIVPTTLTAQDKSKEMVEVIFTQDMDKADLDSIKYHVKRSRVSLQITNVEYQDGLLHTIDFSVSTPKANGTASGEIKPDKQFGFRYDPSGGSEYVLLVGSLDVPSKKKKEKE
jgi:hypothetical protein